MGHDPTGSRSSFDPATETFFGTDGIRDQAGEGRLTPGNVRRVGRAIARFAKERVAPAPRVFVGRDPRPSGPALLRELAEGMAAEGVALEDGGVLPTPAVAWWSASGACDVGVVLTASHNPVHDNGVKVFLPGGRKTSPEAEEELEAGIRRADERGVRAAPIPRTDAIDRYVAAAVEHLAPGGRLDGMRLVVDCANGATMATAPRILRALGATVATPVGSAAGGVINDRCGTQFPGAWQAAVVVANAGHDATSVGLAFDGDGDRVLLADERGTILDGDPILFLLARDLAARNELPGRRVIASVMSNLGLEQALKARGVELVRVPVGDRYVAARQRELGAAVGGEQAGHVTLWWGPVGSALIGDGVAAGVRALQAARRLGLSLARCGADVPRYPQRLRNVAVARKVPLDEAPTFQAAVRSEEAALAGRGRVLVRYSGTEPLLRIMVEGPDDATVAEAVARLETAAATLR
jgi:phosphoglucosamine mutase